MLNVNHVADSFAVIKPTARLIYPLSASAKIKVVRNKT